MEPREPAPSWGGLHPTITVDTRDRLRDLPERAGMLAYVIDEGRFYIPPWRDPWTEVAPPGTIDDMLGHLLARGWELEEASFNGHRQNRYRVEFWTSDEPGRAELREFYGATLRSAIEAAVCACASA